MAEGTRLFHIGNLAAVLNGISAPEPPLFLGDRWDLAVSMTLNAIRRHYGIPEVPYGEPAPQLRDEPDKNTGIAVSIAYAVVRLSTSRCPEDEGARCVLDALGPFTYDEAREAVLAQPARTLPHVVTLVSPEETGGGHGTGGPALDG